MDRGLLAMAGGPQRRPSRARPQLSGDALSDAEVMLRVKAGDESAFEYLVQKYRRPMVSFMYRMAHNSAAAEDLAQEVFLRVYRSRESYEASAKFTTWLYRIATNLAVNHARDTRHERPENTVSLDEPDERDRADDGRARRLAHAEEDHGAAGATGGHPAAGAGTAGAAADGSGDAQVSANGLSPDRRRV